MYFITSYIEHIINVKKITWKQIKKRIALFIYMHTNEALKNKIKTNSNSHRAWKKCIFEK